MRVGQKVNQPFWKHCSSTNLESTSARRAMIVDLALSVTGSQLIASVLPTVGLRSRSGSLC